MVILVGMLGSLTMLTAFTCVILMPVSDATVLMFTTPLFTMIFAAIFLKERLTVLKIICGNLITILAINLIFYLRLKFSSSKIQMNILTLGIALFLGVILVTKPPFIFHADYNYAAANLSSITKASDDLIDQTPNCRFFTFNALLSYS